MKPRRSAALTALLLTFQISTASFAQAPQAAGPAPVAALQGVTFENEVLRIRLDRPVTYRVFSLEKPQRLVVELSHTLHGDKPYEAPLNDKILKKIRFAQFQTAPDKIARVVLEISKQAPFEAVQEGNDILIRFDGKKDAAASAPKGQAAAVAQAPKAVKAAEPEEASLSGQAEETLESAATTTTHGSLRSRGRDILASLPRNPVTIDFDDAEISDVLRVLSEMSGINIIHAANVRGTVSVHLDQVPFNEAFSTILTMQGLVAQQMGSNVLRILTPEDLNADRSRAVVTYKNFILNYANANEIVALLSTVRISPSGKAEVNARDNSIIVTDTPEGIAAAERLISELDSRPQQVLIEAKIVEVSLNNSMDLGIRWELSDISRSGGTTRVIGTREAITGNTVPLGSLGFTGVRSNVLSGTPEEFVTRSTLPGERGTGVNLPNTSPASAGISFGFINNTDLLTMTLNALATEGKTKVLSSPRIITLNNKEAKIQVGSKLPFSTVVVSPGGTTTQSITFVDVGIILDVTPVINADNRVRLHLKPEVSLPGLTTTAGPQINTRNAETEVIIRDGETLVVGGLIDEQTRQSVSKVPLLGDIPVLGAFFRSSFDQKNRTELLIFVTPRIVRD
jgi:type IV pilus assembly protein PilQ